tara:strand:+ start:40815 stop:41480 length:666 start_codon:yes stop_codon:yes gene_type:complete
MPAYPGLLEPLGGGGDTGWQLVKGRDISIPSSHEIDSFESDSGGSKTKVNLTDHRFEAGDVIKMVEFSGNNDYYTGNQTIDSVSSNFFVINTSYQSTNAAGYRAAPPPAEALSDGDAFLVDIGATGDQSKTKHILAQTIASYTQTKNYPDDTSLTFGTNNDFSFKFENSGNVFKLYNGSDEVFSISASDGVLTLPALASEPSAKLGGLYFDGTDFYLGIDV